MAGRLLRFSPLEDGKKELIDYLARMFPFRSFADLGGAWCPVEGGYTFYTLERYQVPTSYLVDTYVSDGLLEEVGKYPGLIYLQREIGAPEVAEQIGEVDVVFLFDVLLTQAKPTWEEVLQMYAGRTKCFLISNVQFNDFPHAVRLLDLGKEEYFRCVPYTEEEEGVRGLFEKLDEVHPLYGSKYRDCPQFWHWALTDGALICKMKE